MTKLRNFELNLLDFKGAVDRRFNELASELPGKMKRDLQQVEEREQALARDIANKIS
jgi:hypothetical protein